MALREARSFCTGLCREAVLHRCSLVSSNMVVRAVSGCRVRARGIEAALRNLILQGSCCIAQPHGQRGTAVTAKRMTSPYGVMVCPELVPSRLSSQSLCFAKQTQGSPYQATFRDIRKHMETPSRIWPSPPPSPPASPSLSLGPPPRAHDAVGQRPRFQSARLLGGRSPTRSGRN